MADDSDTRGCRLPGCGGPHSGVCINSLPFDECPDVIELDEDDAPPEEPVEAATETVALPGGRSLDAAACDALLRQRGGVVVGIVAGPDVGKTTLIATIYELLHRHRMTAFGFAGSETLRGYEERCHLARLSSNAAKPDTPRTSSGVPLSFTHMRIASSGGTRDIFFSDRSGEHFESALARPGDIGGFVELHRADAIILLVDLMQLVRDMHVTVSSVRRLFMAMDQNRLLEGKKVYLVGTKADVAMPTVRSKKAEKELAAVTDELNGRAAGRFTVGRHIVSCRARKGSTSIGEGVEPLLGELLASDPPRLRESDDAWPSSRTELDQLMRRYRSARP